MNIKDFSFLNDYPELSRVVTRLTSTQGRPRSVDEACVMIEMVYRAGKAHGIECALEELGLKRY